MREYSRISEVLQEYFGDNLKSIRVEREFIEYKLFNSVDSQTLRVMGKKLKPLFVGKEQQQSAIYLRERIREGL